MRFRLRAKAQRIKSVRSLQTLHACVEVAADIRSCSTIRPRSVLSSRRKQQFMWLPPLLLPPLPSASLQKSRPRLRRRRQRRTSACVR